MSIVASMNMNGLNGAYRYGNNNSSGGNAGVSEPWRASAEGLPAAAAVPAVTRNEENKPQNPENKGRHRNFDSYECQTCKNRKYQDGSDDPGVSFKSPTRLDPDKAAVSVRAHENEHVTREQAKAQRTGRKVVSQSVTYHSSICPECGRVYTSGGTTRTVTKAQVEQTYGLSADDKEADGKYINMAV